LHLEWGLSWLLPNADLVEHVGSYLLESLQVEASELWQVLVVHRLQDDVLLQQERRGDLLSVGQAEDCLAPFTQLFLALFLGHCWWSASIRVVLQKRIARALRESTLCSRCINYQRFLSPIYVVRVLLRLGRLCLLGGQSRLLFNTSSRLDADVWSSRFGTVLAVETAPQARAIYSITW